MHDELWRLEEQFWTGDAKFYAEHLASDCVMVFPPPAGAMTREQIVASIAEAPRWSQVQITDRRPVELGASACLLTYAVQALREGASYEALAASAYVRSGDSWRLAFHQQTPAQSSAKQR